MTRTTQRRESASRSAGVVARFPGVQDGPDAGALKYLRRGLTQPGRKLPLFDEQGQEISADTIRHCLAEGWAEPWFHNPTKPDWLVCRLTDKGVEVLKQARKPGYSA